MARRAGRVHAALTALAFALSSLFGLIHEGTTTHVRCAEHGELIDGAPVAAPTGGALVDHARPVTASRGAALRAFERQSREVQDDKGARVARDVLVTHGHDHCAMASAMRESRAVPRAPAVAAAPVGIGQLDIAAPLLAVALHGELYRTAPKTSPPV
jgi:hypothetical protein